MRLKTFFLYLFFLLLAGGHYFYASTAGQNLIHTTSESFKKSNQIKHINDEQCTTLIEDTDVDCEEEYTGNDKSKTKFKSNESSEKQPLHGQLLAYYHHITTQLQCTQRFISLTSNGNTLPIYITQKKLRI